MLRHLIVPVDESPASESALWRLGVLMTRPETEVLLVHALEPPMGTRLDPGLEGTLTDREREGVEGMAKRLRERGVRCGIVVREGRVAELVVSVAGDYPEGMIAMSTHGHGAFAHAVFGGVTQDVLRASPVPVLLLRLPPEGDPAGGVLHLRRILVAIDGSGQAHAILPHVAELARSVHAAVVLIHVLPPRAASGSSVNHADRVLASARRFFLNQGIEPGVLLRSGDPAEEILDAARQGDADLIACTTHGRSGLSRVVMGSIAEKLLQASPAPLLVVRSPLRTG